MGLVDFGIAWVVLIGMMLVYGIVPGVAALAVPLFILTGSAHGPGRWHVALRPERAIPRRPVHLPFLTQLWLFATPVAYPSSLLPEPRRSLYGLNPMAGVVEGFRWALLGRPSAPGPLIAVSVVAVLVLLIGGLWYFTRMEQTFADFV